MNLAESKSLLKYILWTGEDVPSELVTAATMEVTFQPYSAPIIRVVAAGDCRAWGGEIQVVARIVGGRKTRNAVAALAALLEEPTPKRARPVSQQH